MIPVTLAVDTLNLNNTIVLRRFPSWSFCCLRPLSLKVVRHC